MAEKDEAHPYLELAERTFMLIGDPVKHSRSPQMHNALYHHLADTYPYFKTWSYESICCKTEEEALEQIGLVRAGHYWGMNITMPYKKTAMQAADYVDGPADVAGGANVLVRKDLELHAFNTDGVGAINAIERMSNTIVAKKHVCVCGTGPTSMAIACAAANKGAAEVVIFSRDIRKSRAAADRIRLSLPTNSTSMVYGADYSQSSIHVPKTDVFIDATPRGMKSDDEAIVDTNLFHEGQIVLDVVYAHGLTALIGGARQNGAFCLDGLEMLVEQAALSVEIWTEAMGLNIEVSRDVMREAACK